MQKQLRRKAQGFLPACRTARFATLAAQWIMRVAHNPAFVKFQIPNSKFQVTNDNCRAKLARTNHINAKTTALKAQGFLSW